MKKWYDERVENKDDCHFNGYKKLNINGLFWMSFFIIKFAFDKKNFNRKNLYFLFNSQCVFIKTPLMLIMIMVVPTKSITFAWR
jgi:hypothetical protein